MKKLILNFTQQLTEALKIGESADLTSSKTAIKNVLVSGLGGSGIGGTLVGEIVSERLNVPFIVNKNYSLPSYIDESTLVIISSYSGNTEETIAALNIAIRKKAQIVCVSSGGEIIGKAKQQGINHIIIPGGMPPRACLGYSFVQQLFILKHFGLITSDFEKEIRSGIELLNKEEHVIQKSADDVADKLLNKIPIIYISADMESVAIRFRQQLNENAKMLAWHHVFPEMNHNELVGWRTQNDKFAVLIFRNDNDFERTRQRMEICKEVFQKYTSAIYEIYSKGNSFIEKALYLIHLGDWISCYLAEKRKVDPVEVNVIDHLKGELAKR